MADRQLRTRIVRALGGGVVRRRPRRWDRARRRPGGRDLRVLVLTRERHRERRRHRDVDELRCPGPHRNRRRRVVGFGKHRGQRRDGRGDVRDRRHVPLPLQHPLADDGHGHGRGRCGDDGARPPGRRRLPPTPLPAETDPGSLGGWLAALIVVVGWAVAMVGRPAAAGRRSLRPVGGGCRSRPIARVRNVHNRGHADLAPAPSVPIARRGRIAAATARHGRRHRRRGGDPRVSRSRGSRSRRRRSRSMSATASRGRTPTRSPTRRRPRAGRSTPATSPRASRRRSGSRRPAPTATSARPTRR